MYEVKIYRGDMSHGNDEWYKKWRRIDFSVQNWHEELAKMRPEPSKISKISTLLGCVWPKYIMLELKVQRSYVGCYWILAPNLKENWFVLSKLTLRIWKIFTRALTKEQSQNWDFDGILLSKVENVWP